MNLRKIKINWVLLGFALIFIIAGFILDGETATALLRKIHPRGLLLAKHLAFAELVPDLCFIFAILILVLVIWYRRFVQSLHSLISMITQIDRRRFVFYLILAILTTRVLWITSHDFVAFSKDSAWYHEAAESIFYDQEYAHDGDKTAFMPPGNSATMAIFYMIFGKNITSLYIMNIVMQIIFIISAYLIASRIFKEKIARIAGILMLFLPSFVIFSGIFLTENGFTAFLMLSLYFVIANDDKLLNVILSGIFLAIAIYFRPVVIPLVVLYAAFIILSNRKQKILKVVMFTTVVLLIHLPWTIRNYRLFDRFVPVSTNGGINLFIGNNPEANGAYWWPEGTFEETHLSEAEKSDKYRDLAVKYMTNNPGRTISLACKKLIYIYIQDTDGIQWMNLTNENNISIKYQVVLIIISQIYYYLIMIFAIMGIITILKSLRLDGTLQIDRIFLLAMIIYFSLVYSLFFAYNRFHFPIMPIFIIFGSIYICSLIDQKVIVSVHCFPRGKESRNSVHPM